MSKSAPKISLLPNPELDDSGETEAVVGEEGYGDREQIVVPFRDDLQEMMLEKHKKDLQYIESFLNAGQLTDNPALDKDVKSMRRQAASLRIRIAALKAELEGK